MMELNFKTNDIAFEVKEHVAYILLNKPEQYNPISAEAMQDLSQCLTYCEEHDDVRAVVIRGAGGNFSAGGNVKAMKERLVSATAVSFSCGSRPCPSPPSLGWRAPWLVWA